MPAAHNWIDPSRPLTTPIELPRSAKQVSNVKIGFESTSVYSWRLSDCLFDLAPPQNTAARYQSRSFQAEEHSMTKTGNKYLRYYLVEAASSFRVHNEEYKRFYQRKYNEVPKHQHKRALVLTAPKFVRLVHSMLRSSQSFL